MEPIPFIPDQLYLRADLHTQYGGNRQSGITPSQKFPYIFIFSGKSGMQYGYQDGWDNESIYSYTGEGQVGDMQFNRGNLALRDHMQNGKRLFLFEIEGRGYVKFICELQFYDVDYFETPDSKGNKRVGIKFFFKRVGAYVPVSREKIGKSILMEPGVEYAMFKPPNQTERAGLVTSRVGQGAYRKRIIHRWKYQCAVTQFDKLEVLIASHIVPWADATDNERLDVHNGLLLSPTYDALFDKRLISFENNGKIILSKNVEKSAFAKIGVTGLEYIHGLSNYNIPYLERHRDQMAEY